MLVDHAPPAGCSVLPCAYVHVSLLSFFLMCEWTTSTSPPTPLCALWRSGPKWTWDRGRAEKRAGERGRHASQESDERGGRLAWLSKISSIGTSVEHQFMSPLLGPALQAPPETRSQSLNLFSPLLRSARSTNGRRHRQRAGQFNSVLRREVSRDAVARTAVASSHLSRLNCRHCRHTIEAAAPRPQAPLEELYASVIVPDPVVRPAAADTSFRRGHLPSSHPPRQPPPFLRRPPTVATAASVTAGMAAQLAQGRRRRQCGWPRRSVAAASSSSISLRGRSPSIFLAMPTSHRPWSSARPPPSPMLPFTLTAAVVAVVVHATTSGAAAYAATFHEVVRTTRAAADLRQAAARWGVLHDVGGGRLHCHLSPRSPHTLRRSSRQIGRVQRWWPRGRLRSARSPR